MDTMTGSSTIVGDGDLRSNVEAELERDSPAPAQAIGISVIGRLARRGRHRE